MVAHSCVHLLCAARTGSCSLSFFCPVLVRFSLPHALQLTLLSDYIKELSRHDEAESVVLDSLGRLFYFLKQSHFVQGESIRF